MSSRGYIMSHTKKTATSNYKDGNDGVIYKTMNTRKVKKN